MNRVTCRRWTTEQIELLRALVESGASAARASVVLKRPKLAVQNKARQLGRRQGCQSGATGPRSFGAGVNRTAAYRPHVFR